jgi:membrane-bound ClpP family serine protease
MVTRLIYYIAGGIQIILGFLGFSSLPYVYYNHIPLALISSAFLIFGGRLMYLASKG